MRSFYEFVAKNPPSQKSKNYPGKSSLCGVWSNPASMGNGLVENVCGLVCGPAESKVKLYHEGECNVDMPGKDGWKKASLQITFSGDKEADIAAHCKSKKKIINRLCRAFKDRYTKQLDDPIVQAFIVFGPGLHLSRLLLVLLRLSRLLLLRLKFWMNKH